MPPSDFMYTFIKFLEQDILIFASEVFGRSVLNYSPPVVN